MSRQAILAPVTRFFMAVARGCYRLISHRLRAGIFFPRPVLTLTGNGTVQSVTLDHETLPCALPMCLQHVDSLDGVLFLATRVDRADGQHGIDSDGSEKVVIPVG